MKVTHDGSHGPDCFGCKIRTIMLTDDQPKTHVPKNGNPWENNPVVQRIEELTGSRINTDIERA